MSASRNGTAANGHHPTRAPASSTPGKVRLRRLELHGFKTFASRAALEFAPGITAVVGPNGSGKSNVADGVRWVLGEQSLRLLRGRKSEDVIFAGGAGRAPLGMAEVHLTLENAGGALPLDFAEVEIGRRAYRSGESEYYLNRGRVRLRDVVDVLSRAGIGQNGHSVIGQGMVDLALSLRPEERRALFEDAGGQRRFQTKKQEAEAKLAEAHANATRVADVIAELEPRLAALKRQARRAEDEARLRAEVRVHLAALLAHQRWEIETHLATLRSQTQALTAARDQALQQAAQTSADAEQSHRTLVAARETFAGVEREAVAAREALEHARRQAAVEQERRRAAERTLAEARAQVQRATQRLAGAQVAVPAAERAQAAAAAALHTSRGEAAAAQHALAAAQQRDAENVARRQAGEAMAETARRLTQVTTQLREVARQLAAVRKQQHEASGGQQRALASAQSVATRLAELAARTEQRDAQRHRIEADRAAASTARQVAERDGRALGDTLAQVERQIGALEAKLAVLRDVARGGAPRPEAGAQGASQRSGPPARRVAEHWQVPLELEAAVATHLGPALDWVVVETTEQAAALAVQRARDGGDRITYIARQAAEYGAAPAQQPLPEHEGGVGYLDDLLPEPEAAPLRRLLVGDAYVVRTLPLALALHGRLNGEPRPHIVTLAGEMVHPHGAITAGAPPDEAATLRRVRQLREGQAELARLQAERTPLAERLAAVQAALQQHLAAEQEADGQLRDLLRRQSREEGERRAIAQQQARLERDVSWWNDYQTRATAQLADLERQVATLRREHDAARQAHDAASERARALAAAAEQQQAEIAALRDRAAAARTAAAVAEQQLTQAAQRVAAVRAAVTTAQDEFDLAQTRLAAATAEHEALGKAVVDVAAAAEQGETKFAALDEQVVAARRRVDGLQAHIEQQRRRAQAARETAAQAERDAARLAAEQATLAERRRALHDQAARELGELPPAQPAGAPEADLAGRVERGQQRLRALGPVNQVALQEHAEASERLAFLKTQVADLQRTAAALETAKAELEAGLRDEFGHMFDAVAEHFRVTFRQLFGGGDARLSLTDPHDLAATGVEITAQLPGKRRQELALLSGGERALVAAALLFALLKARPSPFCVMDEVDAALDEANVGRFCDLLQDLSAQTQFVVITHNRATMERADALYGVTLGEDGVSRVVSLDVRAALATVAGVTTRAGGTGAAGAPHHIGRDGASVN